MTNILNPGKKRILSVLIFLIPSIQGFAQKAANWELDKWPVKLETDFALSALPPQLRQGATVYLLDPKKGYYIAQKGFNGFVTFVSRTEWEWAEFRNDVAAAISYDAEGAKTYFRVSLDVAAMRASGKYTAAQINAIVKDRITKGIYKAPARPGISYMLAPIMRVYTGDATSHQVMTMKMPHYMFYAPYLTNADIGNIPNGKADGPFVSNPGAPLLGARKSPYGFMIVMDGEKDAAKIISDNKDLLKRLADYKSFFK